MSTLDSPPAIAAAPAAKAPAAPAPRPRWKPLLALALLLGGGVLAWRLWFSAPAVPAGVIQLSGRIEGDDSAVGPQTAGRILQITVREGDSVEAGQVLAVLGDDQIRAREDQARAALAASQAQRNAASGQIGVLQQELVQSQLQAGQAKLDTAGNVKAAEASLAAAQSDLAQQQAAYQIAAFNRDAFTRLAAAGAASEQEGLQATATAEQDAAAVTAAQRRVDAAQGALTAAQAELANPDIRQSQIALVRQQIVEQNAQIAAADAAIGQARAELAAAEANRRYLTVVAPFTGTIATRTAEPGEVVTEGTPIVTLIDLTKVYLRGYVAEGEIGRVRVGQLAHVFLDSDPDHGLDAWVSRIDPEATFTPENTYFRDDRVKEVVGLKLQLKEGFGFAKPGMPADGEILTQGAAWPNGRHR